MAIELEQAATLGTVANVPLLTWAARDNPAVRGIKINGTKSLELKLPYASPTTWPLSPKSYDASKICRLMTRYNDPYCRLRVKVATYFQDGDRNGQKYALPDACGKRLRSIMHFSQIDLRTRNANAKIAAQLLQTKPHRKIAKPRRHLQENGICTNSHAG